GTGKSAFAVFTANLLNHRSGSSTNAARRILSETDPELASMLGMTLQSGSGLIPITVTGTREPVEGAILRGLQTAVSVHLNGTGKSLTTELKRAQKRISNGKPIGSRRVTELVADGIERLCKNSRGANGVFLVLDELGKLLEYASHHPTSSDLFTLQELAEHFARSDRRCLLLGILHQDFGAYATRLSAEERSEWDKIRGRFEDIAFSEPAEEMLRLVSTAMSATESSATKATINLIRQLGEQAWKLGLAPGSMSKHEFVSILEGCAPLHPVVAVSIGTIFRRLAQNERSAFSFLCSNEPFGLTEFAPANSVSPGLYGLDRLYDYLSHSNRDALYSSPQAKMWAETESILHSLSEGSASDEFLIKTIGLINAIGRYDRIKSSRDILTLASRGCLKKALGKAEFDRVLKRKIVIDRTFNQTLNLWEGSDVDIDAEVRAARGRIDRDASTARLAERYFPCRPVVARRHSFETGTFRYFTVYFVEPKDIGHPRDNEYLSIEIVLPESEADDRKVRRETQSAARAKDLGRFICLPSDRQEFSKGVRELAALEWIRENVKSLEGDRPARRELAIRIEGVRKQLTSLLSRFLAPDDNPRVSTWFCAGKALKFSAVSRLQDQLSATCDEVFSKSPHILNELINRRQLSSAAAKARRNLIERMFSHRSEPELGLEKAPPEKSIYLSVLARAGLHAASDDTWDFQAPSKRNETRIQPTWSAITRFFKKTESGSRPVSELFDILAAPPFGILEGPLPVLFCAALLVHDNEVALYKDGTFIPVPGAPDFELLVKHPDRYTIQRWHVTGVRAAVFQRLAKLLDREIGGKHPGKSQILDLVKPLLRFYHGLNKFTLQTQDLSDEALAIRAALGKATEPDTL
ncbi:MAG: hypothetical protein IID46_12155, partial [Planctomycetes bacterium]|nr:hypothetical protein [Planctomycetota bacterium]